jgi:hypothetical protein
MNNLLRRDLAEEPRLFSWFGGISRNNLDDWMAREHLRVPEDLLAFWQELGGGDLFETETILGPFGDPVLGDDVKGVNDLHHGQGLPAEYFLFHKGLYMSAVRQGDGKYVKLSSEYSPIKEYPSMDEWYSDLRSEYSDVYDLRKSGS